MDMMMGLAAWWKVRKAAWFGLRYTGTTGAVDVLEQPGLVCPVLDDETCRGGHWCWHSSAYSRKPAAALPPRPDGLESCAAACRLLCTAMQRSAGLRWQHECSTSTQLGSWLCVLTHGPTGTMVSAGTMDERCYDDQYGC